MWVNLWVFCFFFPHKRPTDTFFKSSLFLPRQLVNASMNKIPEHYQVSDGEDSLQTKKTTLCEDGGKGSIRHVSL